jgi:hypothetical protein
MPAISLPAISVGAVKADTVISQFRAKIRDIQAVVFINNSSHRSSNGSSGRDSESGSGSGGSSVPTQWGK